MTDIGIWVSCIERVLHLGFTLNYTELVKRACARLKYPRANVVSERFTDGTVEVPVSD